MNTATIRLMSRTLFMPTDITVVFPDDIAQSGEIFPVVWLLHGACGDHRTYLGQVDFESILRKHRCFIVMPSALNSDYGDYPQFGTGYCFRSYFFDELMPFIFSTFPVSPERDKNYILGASMGGFGAMSLALSRPEMFRSVGMLGSSMRQSQFLEEYRGKTMEEFRRDALENPRSFPTEYGNPESGIKLKEVNIITKYASVEAFFDSSDCMWRRFPEVAGKHLLPEIYVACGTADLFYPAVCRFRELVETLGVQEKVKFNLPAGVGHSETFFASMIGSFFDIYEV